MSRKKLFFRQGQVLAWMSVALLVIQMMGGPGLLMRLVIPVDPFTALSLQYLCTGYGISKPGTANPDGQQPGDMSSNCHNHCLLCRGGMMPWLPVTPSVIFIALAFILLASWQQRSVFTRQFRHFQHRSRAPPIAA